MVEDKARVRLRRRRHAGSAGPRDARARRRASIRRLFERGMRRLLILRPEPGASATVERARSAGPRRGRDAAVRGRAGRLGRARPGGVRRAAADQRQCGAAWRRASWHELRALPGPCRRRGDRAAPRARPGSTSPAVGDGGVERLLGSLVRTCACSTCAARTGAMPTMRRQAITAARRSIAPRRPPAGPRRGSTGSVAVVHSPRAGARLAELVDEAGIDRARSRSPRSARRRRRRRATAGQRSRPPQRPTMRRLLALAARLCDKPDAAMTRPAIPHRH